MSTKSAFALTFLSLVLAACADNSADQARPASAPPVLLANTVVGKAIPQSATVSIAGFRSDYRIVVDGERVTVTNKEDAGDVQEFTGVALIKFVDKHTSLRADGIPAQVYRLYRAAFNRKPDLTGLGFWIYAAEDFDMTMESIAVQFLSSPESIRLYGEAPTNARILTAAYNNVLHRVPDQSGFDWWLAALNNGLSKQSMLYSFSESPENKGNLELEVANGVDYAPYVAPQPNTSPVDIPTIIATVQSSNIDFLPGFNGRPMGTWHWAGTPTRDVMVYVPQPTSNVEQDYASKVANSIAQINAKLNGLLTLQAVHAVPLNGNYIRVSYNTAYVPAGSTNYSGFCANVSTEPYSGNPVTPGRDNSLGSNPVYVNLGNGHCNVTQDIVTHEFGHALGLANHFEGFGANGTPPISTVFWNVLSTLYGNPRSTLASDIIVKPAK